MKQIKQITLAIGVAALLATGCKSNNLYGTIITITQVRDSTMKEFAKLDKEGFINPELDIKITEVDSRYRALARATESALTAYHNGGSQTEYINVLNATRAAVGELINLLRPIGSPVKISILDANLKKASSL